MRLYVSRLMLEREREVVDRFAQLTQFEIDYSKIAIGLSHVVAIADRFLIRLGSLRITLLVQQQRLFKRGQQMRQTAVLNAAEQIELTLEFGFNLADGLTLPAQFADAPELRQCLEVITEIVVLGWGALDDALVGPAADGAFT